MRSPSLAQLVSRLVFQGHDTSAIHLVHRSVKLNVANANILISFFKACVKMKRADLVAIHAQKIIDEGNYN